MKVLFLDIDGVLNNFKDRNFGEQFSGDSCLNLMMILYKIPDLKIVISSSWRIWGLEYMQKILTANGIDGSRVIDITGKEDGIRGHQIQCWLDRNPGITSFVILDDESDMGDLFHRLVKTNSRSGLTFKDAEEVIEMFGWEIL